MTRARTGTLATRRRVALPRGTTVVGWLRHTAWRNVFHALGGFRVVGSAPYETMVIVANHSSHLDTPAVIAAFPSPYRPVVAAADDYWYAHLVRRAFARTFVGTVPVSRTGGGYRQLSDAAELVIGAGSSLLIFPEGTRSVDGTLGHFHAGAARLAREYDVPLLPVAIVGTHDVLPKRGSLYPGPVEVRIGRPIAPEDLDDDVMTAVRAQIADLLALGRAEPSTSRTWRTFHRFMASPWGLAGAAAWGFAEALAWPVTAEMYLAIFGVAHPHRMLRASAALAAGSAAGVVVNAALSQRGVRVPAPLTTDSMRAVATRHMAAGAQGIWRQALNGVPVKLYGTAAGEAGVPLAGLALHAVGARGARAVAFGLGVGAAARRGTPLLRRFFGPYEAVLAVGFGVGLTLVIRAWQRR